MYPSDGSRPAGEDPTIDYIVLAYAGLDGVSGDQLMGQAFRGVPAHEKEEAMRRLGTAGLLEWDVERLWRTPEGHRVIERIAARGQSRGWDGYRLWVGQVLYDRTKPQPPRLRSSGSSAAPRASRGTSFHRMP